MKRIVSAGTVLLVLAGCAKEAEETAEAPAAEAAAAPALTPEQQAFADQVRTVSEKYKDVTRLTGLKAP